MELPIPSPRSVRRKPAPTIPASLLNSDDGKYTATENADALAALRTRTSIVLEPVGEGHAIQCSYALYPSPPLNTVAEIPFIPSHPYRTAESRPLVRRVSKTKSLAERPAHYKTRSQSTATLSPLSTREHGDDDPSSDSQSLRSRGSSRRKLGIVILGQIPSRRVISSPTNLLSEAVPSPRDVNGKTLWNNKRDSKAVSVSSSSSTETTTTQTTNPSSVASSYIAAEVIPRVKSASLTPKRSRRSHRTRNASVCTLPSTFPDSASSNFSFIIVPPNSSSPMLANPKSSRRRSCSPGQSYVPDISGNVPTSVLLAKAAALHVVAPSGVRKRFGDFWMQRETAQRFLVVCFTRGSWSPMSNILKDVDPVTLRHAAADAIIIGDGHNDLSQYKFPTFFDPGLSLYSLLGMNERTVPLQSKHNSISTFASFVLRTLRLTKKVGGVFVFGPGPIAKCIWAKRVKEGDTCITMNELMRGAGIIVDAKDEAAKQQTPFLKRLEDRKKKDADDEEKWMKEREYSLAVLRLKKSTRREQNSLVVIKSEQAIHKQAEQHPSADTSVDTTSSDDHIVMFEDERALVKLHHESARWRISSSRSGGI